MILLLLVGFSTYINGYLSYSALIYIGVNFDDVVFGPVFHLRKTRESGAQWGCFNF
jgi:hypothetical protein